MADTQKIVKALSPAQRYHVERGCISGDFTMATVNALKRKGLFELVISNPYDPEVEQQPRPPKGTRQALSNIEARLTALFGPAASLKIERRDQRHTTSLRYPCERLMREA